jgi:protein-S-isoprenylcysteine O-methyltransferase Ste14
MSSMQWLEAKVPPPVVATAVSVAMWSASSFAPALRLPGGNLVWALVLALAGAGFSALGIVKFRRAGTTLSPVQPQAASSLVCTGIYRATRNPMYVGLLLVLLAWAIFLGSAWALLGPVCFLLYINYFQIAPEERALESLFGEAYLAYKARVRRWL